MTAPSWWDMWLKEERPGEDASSRTTLKKTGLLAVKGRTWYCVMLGAPGGDSYELLIPLLRPAPVGKAGINSRTGCPDRRQITDRE